MWLVKSASISCDWLSPSPGAESVSLCFVFFSFSPSPAPVAGGEAEGGSRFQGVK